MGRHRVLKVCVGDDGRRVLSDKLIVMLQSVCLLRTGFISKGRQTDRWRQMLDSVLVHTLVLRARPEGANTNIICFFWSPTKLGNVVFSGNCWYYVEKTQDHKLDLKYSWYDVSTATVSLLDNTNIYERLWRQPGTNRTHASAVTSGFPKQWILESWCMRTRNQAAWFLRRLITFKSVLSNILQPVENSNVTFKQ